MLQARACCERWPAADVRVCRPEVIDIVHGRAPPRPAGEAGAPVRWTEDGPTSGRARLQPPPADGPDPDGGAPNAAHARFRRCCAHPGDCAWGAWCVWGVMAS
jgi:hypothetical protein